MLRNPLVPLVALASVAVSSGCFGSSDMSTDCSVALLPEPDIIGLEERYALGSQATVRLVGEDPVRLESSDEDIVRIARDVDGDRGQTHGLVGVDDGLGNVTRLRVFRRRAQALAFDE